MWAPSLIIDLIWVRAESLQATLDTAPLFLPIHCVQWSIGLIDFLFKLRSLAVLIGGN